LKLQDATPIILVYLVPHLPCIVIPTNFLEHKIFHDVFFRSRVYFLALLGEDFEFLE
jgi:hypothetical protein